MRLLLAPMLLLQLTFPRTALAAEEPQRLSARSLLALIHAARSSKATLASVAHRIDRRLKKRKELPFAKENTDERYPALSTPWDLPKNEWPFRAILRWPVKIFGQAAELRLLAPLAALDAGTRSRTVHDAAQNIVLLLHVEDRRRALPRKKVQRLLKRLGLSAYSSGELGICDPKKQWCYRRSYALPRKKGARAGVVLVSLGSESSAIGGLKVVTSRQR